MKRKMARVNERENHLKTMNLFVFLVQVRVYSLNEELRKSRRTVTLTFVVSFSLHSIIGYFTGIMVFMFEPC